MVNDAMHHGLPCVVSTQVGAGPDLVEPGMTGEIFESGSTHSLAEALGRVRALANRKEIREACRGKISEFSMENAAEGLARAYRIVVPGPL